MIYFQSKKLAEKLDINLAKWKRWVREFLPPDPLGGLQSGYARQFSPKSAFRVYLGGYLVGALKFTIPEAVRIVDDLDGWLRTNGFFTVHLQKERLKKSAICYRIYIYSLNHHHFGYTIRGVTEQQAPAAGEKLQENFTRTLLQAPDDLLAMGRIEGARVLGISSLYRNFLKKLNS